MKGVFIIIFGAGVFWIMGDLMNVGHTYPIESIIMFVAGSVVLVAGLKILHGELKYLQESEN